MSFLSGNILWNLLWIIPLILVLAIAGGVRRNKLLRKMFGTDERIARFSNASQGKRVFRIILLTLVVLLLAVAAARPSWGKQVMHDTSTGRDLLVLFDVSKSMLSDDVKPSRMDHAKWLVREIVKKNPGDRFGLVAFAGEAFLVCPLTVDRASFIQLVDDLDVDTIPVGGTNVQLALEEAVKAFEGAQGTHKAVVLVTDGDELTGRGASVVNDLTKAQIPIFAVGVGDPSNPAVIRVPDEDGKLRILTDREGNPVKSPLNEPQLTELARRTGGIYVRSTAAYSGIDELETRIRQLDRKESENAVSTFRPIERPAYPLTAAIILLALFFCVSETRPRSVQTMLALAALLLFAVPNETRAQAASAPAKIQQAQAVQAEPDAAEPEKTEKAAPEPVKSASELYNSGLEQQQVEQDNEKARTFYERAIAASEKEPLVRASSYQNIGVISHLDARSSLQGATEKLHAQDLNSAEKAVGEALAKLNKTEDLYRESMRTAAGDASVIRNQQILLADRKEAEEMKKQIEDLKKLMEQARQQTQDAHDQQQQENQQQDHQDQQQNQQQDQNQSGEQNQQQDQQQDQQSGEQNQQQQDQQQDQQSGEQNQQQQNQQQDQQSAQDKTKQAEDTVSELEQKASEMNQDRQKQAAQQAREELQKAREEQEQGNGEKAEEHLKNALDTLNQNQQDQQGEQEKQDEKGGDQGEQNEQDRQQGEQDQQEHPDAKPNQSDTQNQQDMGDMEKQQAEAILDMMSKDELDYKDANRMQRPARLNNRVEKDW